MGKILGQDAMEFGRNNPCHLDLGHDLDQDHGQDFLDGNMNEMIRIRITKTRYSESPRRKYSASGGAKKTRRWIG